MKNSTTLNKKKLFIALLSLVSTITFGQVNVTASGGATSASYTQLRLAFNAINAGTHTGVINIGIAANTTETSSCVLNGSGAGAASYTSILIAPTVDGLTITGSIIAGRGLIELNGADNVTIDGDNPNTAGNNRNLTITNTGINTLAHTSCIRLATSTLITSCDNDIIKNLNIIGTGTSRNTAAFTSEKVSWGIIASGNASTISVTAAPSTLTTSTIIVPSGQTLANLTITNNNIQTVTRGISINGSSTTVAPSLLINNNVIGNSIIGDVNQVTVIGITAQGSANGIISGNIVRIEGYNSSNVSNRAINVGLISATGVQGILIENNVVEKNYNNNVGTRPAIGIDISGGNNHVIRNNFIGQCMNSQAGGASTFNTTRGVFGIRILGGTGHQIFHNTVHLTGAISGTTGKNLVTAFGITSLASTGLDVRNNIFSNQISGGNSTLYNTLITSIYLPSGGTSAMNLTLNNNTYYQGTLNHCGIAQIGTTLSAANLYKAASFNAATTAPSTNLRAYTVNLSAGTNDNASYASSNSTPVIAPNNLHISFASPELPNVDQKGAVSVGLLTDIDGEVRPSAATTNPDIGADEFIVPSCLAANGGTISPSSVSTCVGSTELLTSLGATNALGVTYQWMVSTTNGGPYTNVSGGSGATTVAYTTPPLTLGTYYYILQTTCSFGPLTGFSNQVTVTVNANPVVTLSGSSSFCTGGNSLLTGSTASASQWYVNDSLIVGANTNTFSASSAGYYNIINTNAAGCSDSASIGITVVENALPIITGSATPTIVCSGTTTILQGSGGNSYTWTGGAVNNVAFAPLASGTYTVTGTDINGCTNTATQSITVNSLPTITASATPATLCAGETSILQGAGGSSYTWTGGALDNITFTPLASGTYTVTGTDINGCTNTATQSITVNSIPTITASATPATLCAGEASILQGAGGSSYTWTGGAADNVSFTPLASGTYTVTGTDINGCTNTATQSITVNSLPTITASATPATLCAGETSILQGAGGSSYTWTGGAVDNISFTPSTSGTYTVTGTDINGCSNTATQSITVNSLPSVSMSPFISSVCDNTAAFALTGGSPTGGTYSGSFVSGGIFDPIAAGSGVYIITYTLTDSNTCSNSDTASINVDICSGINSPDDFFSFEVYPNPSNGVFNLAINKMTNADVRIFISDIQGKVIFESVDSNTNTQFNKEINLTKYSKGIYYIKLSSSTTIKVAKIIID
jgi:hypothetical protein